MNAQPGVVRSLVTTAEATAPPIRVVKFGGSLFRRPNGVERAIDWLMRQPSQHTVVVTGGGPWADQVRRIDRRFGLATEASHRQAIRAMTLLAWTLAQLTDWRHVADWQDLVAWLQRPMNPEQSCCVVDVRDFCERIEADVKGQRLPMGWQVTSDSIAARLAVALDAAELQLLKSTLPPSSELPQVVAAGYVDPFFVHAATGIRRIRCVDVAPFGESSFCDLSTSTD